MELRDPVATMALSFGQQVKQALGLKGLFLRNPKQASLDSHAAGQFNRKHSFSSHILRRTASAPTKSQKKPKKGFPEIAIDTKDNSSEGASEDREVEDSSRPRFDQEPECASPAPPFRDDANREVQGKGLKDVRQFSMQRSTTSLCSLETIAEEPFIANENQPAGFCFPLPAAPASDPSEGSVPNHSREIRSDRGSPSEEPEKAPLRQYMVAVPEEKRPLAPNTAIASMSQQGDVRKSSQEANGWGEVHSSVNWPGLQTQDNLALANQWPPSAGSFLEQRESLKRTVDSTGAGPSHQSSTTPTSSRESTPVTQSTTFPESHVVVRRSKSEGHKLCDCSRRPGGFSPAAEVYSDATVNDRIWSKLDSSSHRDSMSSSSSMSSNDTVIDLSLPNLARKSLPDLGIRHENFEVVAERRVARPWSANAASGREMAMVTKSKSNPNLRSGQPMEDELCPRPLARGPEVGLLSVPRKHTWSRLYMESLRQSYLKPKDLEKAEPNQAKSKSLGDLTSDDISCTFESKYRSISRSFVTRSMREQHRCAAARSSAKPPDELMERLKKLTTFQLENDITSPTSLEPNESEEEEEGMGLLRRSSSRSQSRVRYIANRAKQAQERQRLKNLALVNGSPIEERGNPEGACSFARGACMDTASPGLFTSPLKNQTDLNTEAVYMFKL
ncbi:PREDICTED: 1-phosphatidylinositol 4,5-bisphosphate phosphodiesterase eta-2-like [Gekko japonicus]|uniref:1-phosphatidylinositol 4,5-bisphosphate phosphodiesterase eta-2-like n=1 Tax=Gekko japonicus TaxID=146911 RepID=A0ABM1L4A0_GEKJA|nr:PREDICTED: 1-phosphatidylinositol 4,5-bisphosphate phosphodiesterase eta-2-like [Gekko japonicus]